MSTAPRQSPQGDTLRPGKSASTASRTSAGGSGLLDISARLQPRDLLIAALLDEHTVLTTSHLTRLLFDSPITCLHRLHLLRRIGFIDRFIRHQPGRPAPVYWLTGPLAARYTALARGDRPPTPTALRERQDRIYANPALAHLVGVNSFFVDLAAHARHHPLARLRRWWSESRTTAAYGRRIHPDGHGLWAEHNTSVGFFLEYDTGSQPLPRLTDKLHAYRKLRRDGGPHHPVLFYLPTRAREQNLHRRLSEHLDPGVTVATAARDSLIGTGPAGPVWRLYGNGRRRLRLAEIPAPHAPYGPLNPGPPHPGEEPLPASWT